MPDERPGVTIGPPVPGTYARLSACVTQSGTLSRLIILNVGSKYDPNHPPQITIDAPNPGVTALATVSIVDGEVDTVLLLEPGRGYYRSSPPACQVAIPGERARATLTVDPATGSVIGFTDHHVGLGYSASDIAVSVEPPPEGNPPALRAVVSSSGSLVDIEVLVPGSGYMMNSPPVVVVEAPEVAATASGVATVDSGGRCTGVTTTFEPGAGYYRDSIPIVTIDAPLQTLGATRATAISRVSVAGEVTGLLFIDPGLGYGTHEFPNVVFEPPPPRRQAVLEAVVSGVTGEIVRVKIIDAGAGYRQGSPPAVSVAAPPTPEQAQVQAVVSQAFNGGTNGYVTDFTITQAGSGYYPLAPPALHVTLPTMGSAATCRTQVGNDGNVQSVTIISRGHGYLADPVVSIDPPAATVRATATAVVDDAGAVVGYADLQPGAGYRNTARPNVIVHPPPPGVQAAAIAQRNAKGAITALVATTPGGGYRVPPEVTLDQPTGTIDVPGAQDARHCSVLRAAEAITDAVVERVGPAMTELIRAENVERGEYKYRDDVYHAVKSVGFAVGESAGGYEVQQEVKAVALETMMQQVELVRMTAALSNKIAAGAGKVGQLVEEVLLAEPYPASAELAAAGFDAVLSAVPLHISPALADEAYTEWDRTGYISPRFAAHAAQATEDFSGRLGSAGATPEQLAKAAAVCEIQLRCFDNRRALGRRAAARSESERRHQLALSQPHRLDSWLSASGGGGHGHGKRDGGGGVRWHEVNGSSGVGRHEVV